MDVTGTASISEGGGIALDMVELGGSAEGPFATLAIPDTVSIFIGEGLVAELMFALELAVVVVADSFARVRSGEMDTLSNFFERAASSSSSSESESDSDSAVADGI